MVQYCVGAYTGINQQCPYMKLAVASAVQFNNKFERKTNYSWKFFGQ